MKAKSYIISLILIICLILSAVVGYKKGYLGDVFNFKTKNYVDPNPVYGKMRYRIEPKRRE